MRFFRHYFILFYLIFFFSFINIPKRISDALSDSDIGDEVNESTILSIVLITFEAWYFN